MDDRIKRAEKEANRIRLCAESFTCNICGKRFRSVEYLLEHGKRRGHLVLVSEDKENVDVRDIGNKLQLAKQKIKLLNKMIKDMRNNSVKENELREVQFMARLESVRNNERAIYRSQLETLGSEKDKLYYEAQCANTMKFMKTKLEYDAKLSALDLENNRLKQQIADQAKNRAYHQFSYNKKSSNIPMTTDTNHPTILSNEITQACHLLDSCLPKIIARRKAASFMQWKQLLLQTTLQGVSSIDSAVLSLNRGQATVNTLVNTLPVSLNDAYTPDINSKITYIDGLVDDYITKTYEQPNTPQKSILALSTCINTSVSDFIQNQSRKPVVVTQKSFSNEKVSPEDFQRLEWSQVLEFSAPASTMNPSELAEVTIDG